MYKHEHVEDPSQLLGPQKLRLSIQLGGRTPLGFYQYYYEDLKYHKTQEDCFNHVNAIYFEIFGEERYLNYGGFLFMYNKNFKKLMSTKK